MTARQRMILAKARLIRKWAYTKPVLYLATKKRQAKKHYKIGGQQLRKYLRRTSYPKEMNVTNREFVRTIFEDKKRKQLYKKRLKMSVTDWPSMKQAMQKTNPFVTVPYYFTKKGRKAINELNWIGSYYYKNNKMISEPMWKVLLKTDKDLKVVERWNRKQIYRLKRTIKNQFPILTDNRGGRLL